MAAISALPFFGGELSTFVASDSNTTETTNATYFNSTYSRCAVACLGSATFARSPSWPSAADFWMHDVLYSGNYNGGGSPIFIFYNGATVVAQIVMSGSNPSCTAYTLQSGSLTSVGTFHIELQLLNTLDIHIVAGGSGSFTVYVAGAQLFTSTGLNHSGWSGITSLAFSGWNGQYGNAVDTNHSQVICDTTSTVGRILITDVFDTESSTNDAWTGVGTSKLTSVTQIPYNDADYMYAATTGLADTFYQSTLNLGTYNVLARGVGARARLQGAGPANIELCLRSAGTNYVSSPIALTTGYDSYFNSWTTDPATSSTWTPSAAAAIELGVKSLT